MLYTIARTFQNAMYCQLLKKYSALWSQHMCMYTHIHIYVMSWQLARLCSTVSLCNVSDGYFQTAKKAVKFSLFIALFLWSSGSFKFGYHKADQTLHECVQYDKVNGTSTFQLRMTVLASMVINNSQQKTYWKYVYSSNLF